MPAAPECCLSGGARRSPPERQESPDIRAGSASSGLGADEDGRSLGAGGNLQFREDLLQVVINRAPAAADNHRDFAVGLAKGDPAQDFELLLREQAKAAQVLSRLFPVSAPGTSELIL